MRCVSSIYLIQSVAMGLIMSVMLLFFQLLHSLVDPVSAMGKCYARLVPRPSPTLWS